MEHIKNGCHGAANKTQRHDLTMSFISLFHEHKHE